MAIIKEKQLSTGVTCNYWVAQAVANAVHKTTTVLMYLFKDKESRHAGAIQLERVKVGDIDGIYLTGDEVYAFVKESRMETPEPVTLEDGTVEEQEPVETNWFIDAVDDI